MLNTQFLHITSLFNFAMVFEVKYLVASFTKMIWSAVLIIVGEPNTISKGEL